MQSATITIDMKRGGTMRVEAEGDVHENSYGVSGSPVWTEVDDLTCFWPDRKGRKPGKKARVIDPSFYDTEKADSDFIDAVRDTDAGDKADYLLARMEDRD